MCFRFIIVFFVVLVLEAHWASWTVGLQLLANLGGKPVIFFKYFYVSLPALGIPNRCILSCLKLSLSSHMLFFSFFSPFPLSFLLLFFLRFILSFILFPLLLTFLSFYSFSPLFFTLDSFYWYYLKFSFLLCLLFFSWSVVSDSCNPMDCSPLGSSVHRIFQARILEWVVISFCRGSSQPRDQTQVSCVGSQILYHWEARVYLVSL